ncbi:MAG: restriction endonuclease subunit S [Oscillospiraceae bacterium]|nr:restriction endonuclease subunit S [Oscillospiraceae bacterium]
MKEGYKQAEIGVIPEDWEVYTLSDISIINPGSTQGLPKEFFYIDLESVTHGKLIEKKVIEKRNAPSRAQRRFMAGDILYQTVRPYQMNNLFINFDATKYIASTGYAVIRTNESIAARLLYQILHTDRFTSVVLDNCTGTGYPAINPKVLSSLKIAIPAKTSEQQHIAEALSDMDELISSLEKLIEKKKAIKQGAMQELLTGKRRLPGFGGEWEKRKLSTYCSLITKQTGFDYTSYIKPALVKENLPGTLPMIQTINFRGKEFSFNTDYYIPKSVATQFPNIILNAKCVLFSIVGASVGNIGLYPGGTSFCGGAIGITRFFDESDADWVFYYMCSPEGQAQINYVTKGGAQATVTIADIRNFVIPTPEKEEREAITKVMADIDDEIQSIANKLKKTKQIKQSMMQQLLTGKIRLI